MDWMGCAARGVEGIPCEVRSPADVAAMLLAQCEILSGEFEGRFRSWMGEVCSRRGTVNNGKLIKCGVIHQCCGV